MYKNLTSIPETTESSKKISDDLQNKTIEIFFYKNYTFQHTGFVLCSSSFRLGLKLTRGNFLIIMGKHFSFNGKFLSTNDILWVVIRVRASIDFFDLI